MHYSPMATDLADAIVASAERMRREDVRRRSRTLVISRGPASVSATFTGCEDKDRHVRVALDLSSHSSSSPSSIVLLRFRLDDCDRAYESCAGTMLAQLWAVESTANEYAGQTAVSVRIDGCEQIFSSINFAPHICATNAIVSWRLLRARFVLLMHICCG